MTTNTRSSASEDKSAIIEKAMAFQMENVVQRYASDQKLPIEVAQEHAVELKRYLALCATNPGSFYGMRGPIDSLWHTFIMFTRTYLEFCDAIVGEPIHHYPSVPRTADEIPVPTEHLVSAEPNIVEGYKRFLADYETTFGVAAPVHLWPRPMPQEVGQYERAGCVCGCGCRCIAAK